MVEQLDLFENQTAEKGGYRKVKSRHDEAHYQPRKAKGGIHIKNNTSKTVVYLFIGLVSLFSTLFMFHKIEHKDEDETTKVRRSITLPPAIDFGGESDEDSKDEKHDPFQVQLNKAEKSTTKKFDAIIRDRSSTGHDPQAKREATNEIYTKSHFIPRREVVYSNLGAGSQSEKEKSGTISILETTGPKFLSELGEGIDRWAVQDPGQKTIRKPSFNKKADNHIKKIVFESITHGHEKMHFLLDDAFRHRLFSLDGERPRIVCDFFEVSIGGAIDQPLRVNGKIIQQVRVGVYRGSEPKTRIVLDIIPKAEYTYNSKYSERKNIFTLTLKSGKQKSGG